MPAFKRKLDGKYFVRVRKDYVSFYSEGEFVPLPAPHPSAAMSAEPSAASEQKPVAVPDVPPLKRSETPPQEVPNYFDPHWLSTAVINSSLRSCREASKDKPRAFFVELYCLCEVDALRANFGRSLAFEKSAATGAQSQQCLTSASEQRVASPFAVGLRGETGTASSFFLYCVAQARGSADHDEFCACYADALMIDPRAVSASDAHRCEIAAQYHASTAKHFTVRQFNALKMSTK